MYILEQICQGSPNLPQGAEVPNEQKFKDCGVKCASGKAGRVISWLYSADHCHNDLCYLFRSGLFDYFRDYAVLRMEAKLKCNFCGYYTIHSSVLYGDVGVVQLLLNYGANIDTENDAGETPLHLACIEGNLELVSYLLRCGASPTKRDWGHMSALHIGVIREKIDIVDKLLRFTEVDQFIVTKYQRTPLNEAVRRGLTGAVPYLISWWADVNTQDINGQTPLFHAVERGDEPTTRHLLDVGADVHVRYSDGRSILHIATMKGLETCLMMLLAKGANANAVDDCRMNCLHYAAAMDHVNLVRLLVHHGCDINARDIWMRTPVYQATMAQQPRMLKCLFDHGASVAHADIALLAAMKYQLRTMCKILRKHGVRLQGKRLSR